MKLDGLSIRTKFLLLTGFLLLDALVIYMVIAIDLFNKDKRSYLFQSNAMLTESISTETRLFLERAVESIRLTSLHISEGNKVLSPEAISAILRVNEDIIAVRARDVQTSQPVYTYFNQEIFKSTKSAERFMGNQDKRRSLAGDVGSSQNVIVERVDPLESGEVIRLSWFGDKESLRGRTEFAVYLKMEKLLRAFHKAPEFTHYLLDHAGEHLLTPKGRQETLSANQHTWLNRELAAEELRQGVHEFEHEGEKWLGSFSKVGLGGLTVASIIQKQKVFLASQKLMEKTVLFGLFVIFASLLATILFSRKITESVTQLFEATRKIAAGNFKTTVKISSKDEMGYLAHAFNNMVIDLAIQVQEMERAVAEKQKTKSTFSRYVAPAIVDEVLKSPEKLKFGGERRVLSMMFSDVRDFTSISEKLSPTEISECMRIYMSAMTDLIFEGKGTLDKYIGDAIVAFWGAPFDLADHAKLCVETAIKMIERMPHVNEEFSKRGFPAFRIGMGIHTGEVSVGNMGSDRIFSYTALGDGMNVASRVEGLCRFYDANLLVTEDTLKQLGECGTSTLKRPVDIVQVKGRQKTIKVFEIITSSHPLYLKPDALTLSSSIFNHFEALRFKEMISEAQNFLKAFPNDRVIQNLSEFVKKQMDSLPPSQWTSIHAHHSKT